MEQFTKLGLNKEIVDVLEKLGFKTPSEIQEKAIPFAVKGRDIIGGSMTGSGKTLVFASAIIENLIPSGNIQALVLTPTRELAEQVGTAIRKFGKNKHLKVAAVYGGVDMGKQTREMHGADVIVATPGRLIDHLNRRTARLDNVKFLVLDEVDRMFDMGFRKDVEMIIGECPKKDRQTMMFSATISSDIDYLSKKYTKNPVEVAVKHYVDASRLSQVYYDVPDNKKFSLLVTLLKEENANLVMVFCNTRRNAEFVVDNLVRSGINARAIHGGIDQTKRIKVLDDFHSNKVNVLVCTDVASRGLDIKNVTHVYNYEVPSDSKDYVHRIGRTARAGKDGKAITILSSRDYDNFRNLLDRENIKITNEKLPEIKHVRINIDSGREKRRFNGRNNRGNSRGNMQRRDHGNGRSSGRREGNSGRSNYGRNTGKRR